MRYSKLFIKTKKNAKEYESVNATLLQKAGFIYQEMAGAYTFLPLGLRVLNKIEQIVREEMDKIGVEVLLTALAPRELWEKTGRLHTSDVLMKTTGANKLSERKNTNEYILNYSHEELITPIAKEYCLSYKDLPSAYYQIQTKFRNEARAKSGLLRGREFRMKDLYSFHVSEADLKRYYEEVKAAYWKVFERVGLQSDTVIALASGGDFTPDFSHEFQTRCDAGEDLLFKIPSTGVVYNREVAPSKAPVIDDSAKEMKPMEEIEGVGIIGVQELADFLHITEAETTKTLLFENEKGEIIAAGVRGGYDINEEKLRKVSDSHELQLASEETVKRVTGADVGYAGLLNLPKEVRIFMDESMKGRKNFEMGANRTHFHSINVNFGRDLPEPEQFFDIKTAKDGDFYPETDEKYEVFKGCEVGNIFPLNTKFSKAFDYYYTDENSERKPVYMGCYGIGPSRVMGVIVEKFHDDRGMIWPESVAPYQVHLVGLNEKAAEVYDALLKAGIEVLYDDRDIAAGEKFADADLIGIPVRLVVSAKTGDKIEWKKRTEKESTLLTLEEVLQRIAS